MQEDARQLTTASGRPYVENENTLTVGPRGPVLLLPTMCAISPTNASESDDVLS